MIGPNVIQAIIDHTGDNWKGFPFLFALCVAASIVIWFGACSCVLLLHFTLYPLLPLPLPLSYVLA